ncbi:MAG: prepilin-type N-terminal cleavage/methylation domain-containing protein [bacterium]|nr:prepilin-type N-terminal cleavage/methylation domain-containing protein [bacterium]
MKRVLRKEHGFTLVELMMAVSITLLLTSIAVYNMLGDLPKYRLRATANRIASTLQYLKIRAVTTNKVAWFDANYNTAGKHYFTGFVDNDPPNTPDFPADYDDSRLDLPDSMDSRPCFLLPANVTFGFPDGYTSGTGPDNTTYPGAGNFITSYAEGTYALGSGGYVGYRPTGVPVVNLSANNTVNTPVVIYLRNNLGGGYAVSVQITGRVKVWRWFNGGWQ